MYATEMRPPETVYSQIAAVVIQIPGIGSRPKMNAMIRPEPTRLPPRRQQNETIARTEKSASVAGPNLRAKRSGSVSSFISFSGFAKKMPLRTSERPRPSGRHAPSHQWYLYPRSMLPSAAFESSDCEASVAVTTKMLSVRPAAGGAKRG